MDKVAMSRLLQARMYNCKENMFSKTTASFCIPSSIKRVLIALHCQHLVLPILPLAILGGMELYLRITFICISQVTGKDEELVECLLVFGVSFWCAKGCCGLNAHCPHRLLVLFCETVEPLRHGVQNMSIGYLGSHPLVVLSCLLCILILTT